MTILCSLRLSCFLAAMIPIAAFALPPAIGPDLDGWELVTTDGATEFASVCSVDTNGVASIVGKPVSFIQSKQTCADYKLEVQWRWSGKPGNGGILVHISTGPKDRAWPECFQVQLKHGSAGDIIPMAGATFAETLSTPPDAKTPILNHTAPDSERPVGEWNTAIVTCEGDTITVSINGVVQNHITGCNVTSGHAGFQLEGTAFEVRNLSVAPVTKAN